MVDSLGSDYRPSAAASACRVKLTLSPKADTVCAVPNPSFYRRHAGKSIPTGDVVVSVQVGQEAPDFTLKDTDTQDVALSGFRGEKNVVLLFVPFAFTGVCTSELCSVRDNLDAYSQLDAEVLGISVDSPFAQKQWKEKENLNFTLVSDFNRDVSKAYGAQFEELMGFSGVAKRAAFVIDKAGKVQYAEVLASPRDLPNFDKIQETLQGLS